MKSGRSGMRKTEPSGNSAVSLHLAPVDDGGRPEVGEVATQCSDGCGEIDVSELGC